MHLMTSRVGRPLHASPGRRCRARLTAAPEWGQADRLAKEKEAAATAAVRATARAAHREATAAASKEEEAPVRPKVPPPCIACHQGLAACAVSSQLACPRHAEISREVSGQITHLSCLSMTPENLNANKPNFPALCRLMRNVSGT